MLWEDARYGQILMISMGSAKTMYLKQTPESLHSFLIPRIKHHQVSVIILDEPKISTSISSPLFNLAEQKSDVHDVLISSI